MLPVFGGVNLHIHDYIFEVNFFLKANPIKWNWSSGDFFTIPREMGRIYWQKAYKPLIPIKDI